MRHELVLWGTKYFCHATKVLTQLEFYHVARNYLNVYDIITSDFDKFLCMMWRHKPDPLLVNHSCDWRSIQQSSSRYIIMENIIVNTIIYKTILKGQLQRFHKLISNDRIWPSEHGFEVIFDKSLFVFEISAFKVRNKRGIHCRFHSFSENNNRETFACDVTSDQKLHDQYRAQWLTWL